MVQHPLQLLMIWTVIGGSGFALCVRFGANSVRAGNELLKTLSEGRSIGAIDALVVCAGLLMSVLCLVACIYAVLKIRELLES